MALRFTLLLIGLLILAGCRAAEPTPAESSDVVIALAVQPDPPAMGDSTLLVTVTTASGEPIAGATVSARGGMSHAGMVPVMAETTASEGGVYTLPFAWTMGGDWVVDITVTLSDGQEVQQQFEYAVAGTGHG